MLPAKRLRDDSNSNISFKELALEVVNFGRLAGVDITPYRDKHLPFFSMLPTHQKRGVIAQLQNYVAICQATLSEGESLRNTKALLWKAMRHFNFIPCSDLFSTLTDDPIVEIYDLDNIQIFRNFRFFDYCTYTLEDIFCRPWPELFIRRDETYLVRLLEIITQSYKAEQRKTWPGIDEQHIIEEADSLMHHKFSYRINYVSPLINKSRAPAGFVAIEEARVITPE